MGIIGITIRLIMTLLPHGLKTNNFAGRLETCQRAGQRRREDDSSYTGARRMTESPVNPGAGRCCTWTLALARVSSMVR